MTDFQTPSSEVLCYLEWRLAPRLPTAAVRGTFSLVSPPAAARQMESGLERLPICRSNKKIFLHYAIWLPSITKIIPTLLYFTSIYMLIVYSFTVINCGNLPAPKFGSVSLTGVTFGSTATYSCRKGYVLVGVSVRTCQANGQWSGRAPICKSNQHGQFIVVFTSILHSHNPPMYSCWLRKSIKSPLW